MRYIPLANLKNTTGIVNFCKEANEIIVANRNGQPKLVLMSRAVYENGFGKVTEDVYFNVKRDMELVAEPVLIRTFNNPAEIVRVCERESGKVVPVLRNGVDEIYAMDYPSYDSFFRFYKKSQLLLVLSYREVYDKIRKEHLFLKGGDNIWQRL